MKGQCTNRIRLPDKTWLRCVWPQHPGREHNCSGYNWNTKDGLMALTHYPNHCATMSPKSGHFCSLEKSHQGAHRAFFGHLFTEKVLEMWENPMTSDTLTVKADRVREAAASCSQADGVLRKLFPEAFVVAFKPGDRVEYRDVRGVVVDAVLARMCRKEWSTCEEVIFLNTATGAIHSNQPGDLQKIVSL